MTAVLRETVADPVVATRLFGTIVVPARHQIEFPEGIPGFPEERQFALLPAAVPSLAWLQSMAEPALAFLLVTWGSIAPSFDELHHEVYAIVTLPGTDPNATANLQAPVLIDRAARTGRQLIRTDSTPGTAVPFDLEALTTAA